ncbi:MAG TPA: SpoIIE family protein phosphatase [Candidatus Caccalectryoclostridium excrementigallinarum]|uniref:SpoIIE family protein phosphatase n=1 Tax=Candidatus Caccalectryoclostridium excrementigallinarum TaxID=2840710 RepID=A0A9D1MM09_9FIRM|nr:SpoIIE family protein phosphatase [Candidatus Caccalectryoclostridium excrementigallinarum]
MSLDIEYGYTSLNKAGEELCGDNVQIYSDGENTTVVLADGMGSGVKANILSMLTSKILCTMVANEISIEDCVETILETLPVCKVRGVAYATFTVVHIDKTGRGVMFEFDNPPAIYYHEGKSADFERTELTVLGKKVYKSDLALQEGDVIVFMSDGVIHAGIGMLLNFGWQRPEVKEFLERTVTPRMTAKAVACLLAGACNDLYMDKPGDDTTVAAIKLRKSLQVSIMVGAPVNKDMDDYCVEKLMSYEGKKAVCGGTTSQIVARHLGTKVDTVLDFVDKDIPPIGHIDGIDLTTEGVITLRRLLELAEKYNSTSDLSPKYYDKKDGASLLANLLFEQATKVNFLVGQSANIAHKGLPIDITMKLKLVEKLAENLRKMGKQVEIEYN